MLEKNTSAGIRNPNTFRGRLFNLSIIFLSILLCEILKRWTLVSIVKSSHCYSHWFPAPKRDEQRRIMPLMPPQRAQTWQTLSRYQR
jgi:hypothetical protein